MVGKHLADYHDFGMKFYKYLKETDRETISEREKLRKIYDEEFKNYGFGFSTVLYGLKYFGKIKVISGQWIVCTKKLQWIDNHKTYKRDHVHQMKMTEPSRPEIITDQIKIRSTEHQFNPDGKMSLSVDINTEYTVHLHIVNTGTKAVDFTGYKSLSLSSHIFLEECTVTQENPLVLHPDVKHEVCKVKFRAREVGVLSVKLSFEFRQERSAPYCHIDRFIEAQCITALGKELAPTAPYRPRPILVRTPPLNYIIEFGQPPQGMIKMTMRDYKLPKCPTGLIPALTDPTSRDERKRILEASLSWENYAQRFRLLLELELIQMEQDLKKCNIPNADQEEATMERFNKELLLLKVPGLLENRVSVLRGDRLLVYPAEETTRKYCVYVESVQQDTVKLGYNKELMGIFVKGMKFYIEFTLNSLTVGIQLRAVRLAVESELSPVLFPALPPSSASQRVLPDLKLFDRKLELNTEQYRAVQHIVTGSSKPAPYLVFGPPGTGKTVTVAEAIKQILKLQPKSHVVACAPTNSAADQLCENVLKHVDQSEVLRIYAKYLNPSDIPGELKACSNLIGGIFDFPKDFKEKLMKYKVIITTLLTSSRIVTAKVPKGHFTHVFVDEAGHTMETECLLPLAGLLNPKTGQVVLAGDPKQLGPIIKSPFALKFGFGLSLLERLMKDSPLYQKNNDVFDNRFVSKLLRNYRSHPAIIKIPNELFYDGELGAFADEYQRNSYCNWEHLPQKGFPIIFHGVTSLEVRESSCPSFFNIAEVEVLMDYVKKLLETQGKKGLSTLSPQDLGIIAPYWKQVQKIRLALRKVEEDSKLKDISRIKVGSVEEFQGQERRVILMSAVRSSSECAEFDKKFKLGFVKNEKRFNVAVTRAKALLIIVGNPLVLRSDPTWARYIDYCKDQGGYRGL